jgi:hypothetical protein
MVNRVWRHLFGRGLVPTVDNFGRLGETPSHPELLDFLAAEFIERGWSLKEIIHLLVTSRAFQMQSEPSSLAREMDPANELLSHMPVRRLDAEAIRDSLLAVSGRLDHRMFGVGDNALAPPPNHARRSVYLTIRRNSLSPFLEVFDAPKPFTTWGRRDATNVPAQSLALLNDPLVIELSEHWAQLLAHSEMPAEDRVRHMFETAFSRPPSAAELALSLSYLNGLTLEHGLDSPAGNVPVWRDLAQSLFNFKEFIFLR